MNVIQIMHLNLLPFIRCLSVVLKLPPSEKQWIHISLLSGLLETIFNATGMKTCCARKQLEIFRPYVPPNTTFSEPAMVLLLTERGYSFPESSQSLLEIQDGCLQVNCAFS